MRWIVLIGFVCIGATARADFAGWEAMRVIRLEGHPQRAVAMDLDGNGRDEIVVANTRQSRIEVFRWLPVEQRAPTPPVDPDNPNTLPMAVEFDRADAPLEQLPHDVVAHDLDGDAVLELLVLVSGPNRIIACRHDGDAWRQAEQWDLLPGTIASNEPLRLRSKREQLLINFEDGIQSLALTDGARAHWLAPREKHARVDWWLVDFDADGHRDLVAWTRQAGEAIRLYRGADNDLRPAVTLYDKAVNGAAVLEASNGDAELLLLDQVEHGLLRRFVASYGESTSLGLRHAWPVSGSWCGLQLDDDRALITVDSEQPRLNVARLVGDGWQAGQDYPCVANVQDIAPVVARPGMLLLWTKDAADLYVSRWDGSRLSFPRPFELSRDVDDRRILALGVVGQTTWWAQRVGAHVDLYTWSPGDNEPQRTRFADLGEKTEDVRWLGGSRLLYREQYKRTSKLATLEGDDVITAEPSHLAKAELAEFQPFEIDGAIQLARLTDGVLQWLDSDLHPIDQVMLPEGRQLVSYVPVDDGAALALQREGRFIHRLEPDDAGIPRVVDSYETPGAGALVRDPLLGFMLTSNDRVVHLAHGDPLELRLLETADSTIGRPGVSAANTAIHRVQCIDITGDGADEVLLFDDQRHRITALHRSDGRLQPLLSWPVFEDSTYPYGSSDQRMQQEPRVLHAANLDGDDHRDLVMLCHDRLLIYLGRKP